MANGLAAKHREWLEARGISVELAEKFGLETTKQSFPTGDEKNPWEAAAALSVPFIENGKVINHKHRRTSNKQSKMDKGAKLAFCNKDVLKQYLDQPLVITEGEWDMLVAIQCGWKRTVSVPNGAPEKPTKELGHAKRYDFLWDAHDELLKVDRFILATDGDVAGRQLRQELIQFLHPAKCSFVEYPLDTKDLNDVLNIYGPEAVAECLNNAKPVPVEGLHRLDAFPDGPDLPMKSVLIEGLHDCFGLVPSTFSVITGYAGHGKTSLVTKMVANLMGSGTRVTIGSFETLPKPILERRLLAALDERNEHDPSIWKNSKARQILAERLTVIANTPDEEHELDLERLLDLMEVAVAQYGTELFVLDPYNEIEHKRGRDESETEYAGRFIRSIKRFCHRTGTAVWLVAHPRKPNSDGVPKPPSLYDLSGSANFANKADYGLIVHRPNIMTNDIDVHVSKVRMGLPGQVCRETLTFESARSRYVLKREEA